MAEKNMIQIKHRYTGDVLFECEAPADLDSGLHTRYALEKATKARASLEGASLEGANLEGAYLAEAYLARANLEGANLEGANLEGSYIYGANLARANLEGAYLEGAYLAGAKLIGERPIFQIGPIGPCCSYFVAYNTDRGVKLRAGCFFGSVDEFREKLSEEHGTNVHAKEYSAALELIRVHAELWTPAEVSQEAS